MKPVDQTKLHIPGKQNGNCMVAAFASLLELKISDIPEFEDMSDGKWYPKMLAWLKGLGFQLLRWDEEVYMSGYFIATGPSPRGIGHSVVYQGTEMVHDPHPSKEGLLEITSVWMLLPLNPACCLKKKAKKTENVYLEDSIEHRLAQYLKGWILKNNPKAKIPKSLQSWCGHINKMIEVDKRSPEEIKKVIRWCQNDSFWWQNIRSAGKLRKQYDQLYIKMNGRAKQRDNRFDHL